MDEQDHSNFGLIDYSYLRLRDFFHHYKQELLTKIPTEKDLDQKESYQSLVNNLDAMIQSIQQLRNDGDYAQIEAIEAGYIIGRDIGKQFHEPAVKTRLYLKSVIENSIARQNKYNRESALSWKAVHQAGLKEWAQETALAYWGEDNYKAYKIRKMADLVLNAMDIELTNPGSNVISSDVLTEITNVEGDKNEIFKGFRKYFPTSSETVVKWLRDVAPESAKKPGRSKKQ